MKVVITARNFTTGDRSALELLEKHGYEVSDYSFKNCGTGTTEDEMISMIGDAEIVITGLEVMTEKVAAKCPNLKLLSRRSIGYDSVDLEACKRHQISVSRTTGMVEGAVSEQVMAYILWFARDLQTQNANMHGGQWIREMSYGAKNRTLGLVGFGGIGKEIAKRAVPFGMNVIYYCRHPKKEWEEEYGVRYADFDELLSVSDYISANVPLSDSTRRMFGEKQFAKMKKEAVFINIARGQVVDTFALKKALDEGWIRGAGVDAFDTEPCLDSPLMACPNAILTPHTAPFTSENFCAMNLRAAQNVIDWAEGRLEEKYRLV